MSAKLHWMSSNQFNLNYLRYTPSGASTSSVTDLNCDLERTIGKCEGKGLSIYVDLSSSLESNLGAVQADNVEGLKTVSMEPSSMGLQNGPSPSYRGVGSEEELRSNGLTPHTDSLTAGFEGSKGLEARHGGEDKLVKNLCSMQTLPVDFKIDLKESIVERKGGHVQGSMSMKQAARQSYQKSDQKQLGKREGTQSERETSQQKRSRLTSSKVVPVKIEKDGCKLPAGSIPDKSASTPRCKKSKLSDENGGEALAKQGVDVVVNSAEPGALPRPQPKPRARDITKEEAALEFQQCVSLLWKYGVLNTREYYLSQSFPSCAQHPGFVGDRLQSRRCKICKAIEDANSTVICDGCQESFHLSCCLPRLHSKHFDKDDDWYCGSCRKQKRRMGRFFDSGRADSSGDSAGTSFISKVKVGSAYQANVPLWSGKADPSSTTGPFGMEQPLSEDTKEKERAFLLKEFELKTEKWRQQLANNPCDAPPENWLKCHGVLVKAFTDCNGHEHSEIICGKWRRAPPNMQQFDRWECFCAIEWDPSHADCAVPQEIPTEEVLQRMQLRSDPPLIEVGKKEEA